jgi:hypothetical protein
LQQTGNGEGCHQSFVTSFPPARAIRTGARAGELSPGTDDGFGKLPLCVVEAVLATILPVMDAERRNHSLDISQACRDAHPDCRLAFDQWQRQSDRYHKSPCSFDTAWSVFC